MNRLHPLSAVAFALQRGVVGLAIPFFLVSILSGVGEVVDVVWIFVLAPLGFVLGAAYGVAYYYRFGYVLTGDTFDVASGVFSRRSREIPYRRIQNVDVRQGVLFRVLGLAVVSIETAGGGSTEGVLNFVSEEEADHLRREIRRRTAALARDREADRGGEDPSGASETTAGEPGEATPAADAGEWADERPTLLFELAPRELLLYSFTSVRPAAFAGVLALFFFFTDVAAEYALAVARPVGGPETIADATPRGYLVLSLVSIVHGVVLTYALSVAYTFATYYGFRLGRAGTDFVYERGLLQRYSGSIPVEKVQSVTVTANPVQRAIGYAGLWVETAGYGPESSGGSQSAVPLAADGRVYRFAENLTGVERPSFERPPGLARRRYLVRYSLIAAAIVAVAAGVSTITALDRWYLAAVSFLAAPPAAHLRYVHLGYFVGEDHLVVRSGFWKRRTTVIPYYRVQTVNVRRSIFQRRLGLASVVVDTASSRTFVWSTPRIYDVDLADAREIRAETRDRLQVALRERSGDDEGFSVAFT